MVIASCSISHGHLNDVTYHVRVRLQDAAGSTSLDYAQREAMISQKLFCTIKKLANS